MIERIEPEKAVAVIVGIERYDLGETWNLDGAAGDALAFAQWLLDQGVNKERILLYLSPLSQNKDRCDEAGISYQPATRDNVMRGVSHRLNTEPALAGDLLFLYWGGHGMVESDGARYLLFENATGNEKAAVDFYPLLEMLRDKARRTFSHQVGIVDACANYFGESSRTRLSLAGTSLSGAGASEDVRQFVLFASSIGQRAEQDAGRKTGIFSSELLLRLKGHCPAPEQRWPNLNRLRDDLKAHFERLKAERRLRFNQTPASFSWHWPDEKGVAGAALSSQLVLQYERANRLYRLLCDLNCARADFDAAYRATIHPRSEAKFQAHGLEAQIETLIGLPPRKKDELAPLLEFAVRLDRFTTDQALLQWVEKELKEAELPRAMLGSARQMIESEAGGPARGARKVRHVLFDLGGDQVECWHYQGTRGIHHRWLDESAGPPDRQVSAHLAELQSQGDPDESLFLEFFVSFDDGDECQHFDRWEHEVSYLGSLHSLVVRWRDRTLGAKNVGQTVWRKKAEEIRNREALDQQPIIFWLPKPDYNAARLMPYLSNTHEEDCIGFAAAPMGKKAAAEHRKLLQAVLLGGAPFAFWPRMNPAEPERFQAEIGEQLASPCSCVGQLPERLRLLREEAAGVDFDHFCGDLTLLWDDPERNPTDFGDEEDRQFAPPE